MKHFPIPSSWGELNDWQAKEIAHLYLNSDPDHFERAYEEMIFVLYQKYNTRRARRRLTKLISNYPITELEPAARFLVEKQNFYRFLKIDGLIRPTDRMTNISIRQFSTIDSFFFQWNENRNQLTQNRLIASLYRVRKKYSDLDLSRVSLYISKLDQKEKDAITLAYIFTRKYIVDTFPIVFPKPVKEEKEAIPIPQFGTKKTSYVPFDKAIVGMAMEESQPLGKKQDADQVKLYEFFSVMSENIRRHQEKIKNHARK